MSVQDRMKLLMQEADKQGFTRDFKSIWDDHQTDLNELRKGMRSCLRKFEEYDNIISEIVEERHYFQKERKVLASDIGSEVQKAKKGFEAALKKFDELMSGVHSKPE
jgi:hypothetical protein